MILSGTDLSVLPEWDTSKTAPAEWQEFKTLLDVLQPSSGGGFQYEQASDPGAVGAGVWWADTANKIIYRRNAGDTGWDSWTGLFGP